MKVAKKCGTEQGYVAEASFLISGCTGVGMRIVVGSSSCCMVLLPRISCRPGGVDEASLPAPPLKSPESPLLYEEGAASDTSPSDSDLLPQRRRYACAPIEYAPALMAFRPRCLRSRLRPPPPAVGDSPPPAAVVSPAVLPAALAVAWPTTCDVSVRQSCELKCAPSPPFSLVAISDMAASPRRDVSGVSMAPGSMDSVGTPLASSTCVCGASLPGARLPKCRRA
mmetsp:Transcript_8239/g.25417  ORF Transcript_8239/g.25417 Transcript_8239/m.25417 type:complete len:225 (+) Transcript_8239:1815-2489(+)